MKADGVSLVGAAGRDRVRSTRVIGTKPPVVKAGTEPSVDTELPDSSLIFEQVREELSEVDDMYAGYGW